MKKKVLFLTLLSIFFSTLSAASGPLSGEKNLRIVKTQWFDIIYPERCNKSAELLYQNADQIYYEVTEQYGFTPSFKMPVVICPAVDSFNAFWTIAPYNHIVIYDTSVIDTDELKVSSENLLATFRHELTHAVTYNMKNKFWTGFSAIFGDSAVPGLLLVNTGMAEGAAVSSESAGGQGRLNDEYAKHYVKQAKLEGDFPSFYDVLGAADNTPSGAPYYFNSAFHQWLQEKYGLPAYAQFWYQIVNLRRLTLNGSFKTAFGLPIKKAWKLFMDDYPVPSIPGNPLETGNIQDFFNPDEKKYSILNKSGALYQSLTSCNLGVAWKDSFSSKVFYVNKADIGNPDLKPKTLFTQNGLTKIDFSPDGRFLVLSYMSNASVTTKSRVKIYDMKNKTFYSVKESGLKSPAIIISENEYYLIADKYENHENQVYLAKLDLDSNQKIKGLSPSKIIYQQTGVLLSNYKHFADGQFVCIKKQGMSYFLSFFDLDGNLITEYSMPKERMVIRSISVDDGKVFFSWAAPGTMPRLGCFDFSSAQMELSDRDFSGGIYQPICLGDSFVYLGIFLRQNRLLILKDDGDGELFAQKFNLKPQQGLLPKESFTAQEKAHADLTTQNIETENKASVLTNSKAFKPFSYWKKGIFVPLSMYTTSYFGKNATYVSNISESLLGLTYISANPWTNGQNDLFMLTSGWNYLTQALGLEFKSQKGTDTSLLYGETDFKLEFDKDGFKQVYGQLKNSFTYPFGKISYISFANTFTAAYGRQDSKYPYLQSYNQFYFWDSSLFGIAAPNSNINYYTVSDILTAKYTNIHRVGSSRFDKAGFSLSVSAGYRKDASIEETPITYVDGFNVNSNLKIQLPCLIPIKCQKNFVYNLPTHIDFDLFPTSTIFGYTNIRNIIGTIILDVKTESVLFAFEIQKALPFFTILYLNDLYFSGGYAASLGPGNLTKKGFQAAYLPYYITGICQGKGIVYDSVYAKLNMELTPNIGILASSNFKLNLFALMSFAISGNTKSRFAWTLGSQANF